MKCEHSGLEYGKKGDKPCRLVTIVEPQGEKVCTMQSCLACEFSNATYAPNPNYVPPKKPDEKA